MPLPDRKYKIIYADPPWKYNGRRNPRTRFGLGVHGHYATPTLAELKDLEVEDIADDNCMLFMWTTFPRLKEALELMEDWGFTYKTLGFSWLKTTKAGSPFFGVGFYAKSNVEVCLLGVKGRPIKISDSVSSAVISKRGRHSAKPPEVRDRIVQLCGDVPRIELFARERAEGWDSWGDELE